MKNLKVVDNDADDVSIMDGEIQVRGWSYANDAERRVKMLCAREWMEGALYRDNDKKVAPTTSLLIAIENIQGNAPRKEPRNVPTVGFGHRDRNVDPDSADEAIQQAFYEGYTRAMWEVSQELEPIANELTAQITW